MDAFPADHFVVQVVGQRENMLDHFDHDFTEVPPGINYWLPEGGPRLPSSYLSKKTEIQRKIYKYTM